jgi:hypothetical protein
VIHSVQGKSDPYSRVLTLPDNTTELASVAGARPGLQDREFQAPSSIYGNALQNQAPPVTAQGQRARPNDPDLVAVIKAWDRMDADVKAELLAIVRAAAKRGGGK